jgi:hypothetical protein
MSESVKLNLTVGIEFIRALDDWRLRQPSAPSRSRAIQILASVAMMASNALPNDVADPARGMQKPH